MIVKVFKDYHALSLHVADEVIALIKDKPDAILCLAAGDTPRLTFSLIAERARNEKINFSRCTFIGLDEWVGIPPENEGSCHYYLKHQLFTPLGIHPSQIHLFNALSGDLAAECRKMDDTIRQKGGIDLMLVGVGMNGHIGFNEPGVPTSLYAHVISLDETTRAVGQKYFKQATKLQKGITLGLQHLLESRKAIVMASGVSKAKVMRSVLEDTVTREVPATIIRDHPGGVVMLDEDAASLLNKNTAPQHHQ